MKGTTPLNIGFGNFVIAQRIIAVVDPFSSPVKHLIQEARKRGNLLNAAKGKRTRSAIFMDDGTIVLSSLSPMALARRLEELAFPSPEKKPTEIPPEEVGE
jgi:regulator of extracellular matrix RemA (YlzA/DUF370 family)